MAKFPHFPHSTHQWQSISFSTFHTVAKCPFSHIPQNSGKVFHLPHSTWQWQSFPFSTFYTTAAKFSIFHIPNGKASPCISVNNFPIPHISDSFPISPHFPHHYDRASPPKHWTDQWQNPMPCLCFVTLTLLLPKPSSCISHLIGHAFKNIWHVSK